MMSKKEHEEMVKNLPRHEWTNEQQLEWKLERQEESHKKQLERKSLENVELYTDNVLLKRQIKTLQTQVEKGKELISKLQKQLKK